MAPVQPAPADEERRRQLKELVSHLTGQAVAEHWAALRTLSSLDLTTTEVKEHGLGKAVARLSKDETVSLILRQQAQRLVQTWAANLVSR